MTNNTHKWRMRLGGVIAAVSGPISGWTQAHYLIPIHELLNGCGPIYSSSFRLPASVISPQKNRAVRLFLELINTLKWKEIMRNEYSHLLLELLLKSQRSFYTVTRVNYHFIYLSYSHHFHQSVMF